MKRLLLLLLMFIGLAGPPVLAISFYESPDVPTTLGASTYQPWDIVRDDSGTYTLVTTVPRPAALDSLHAMCSGEWLFSVEAPVELPPGSGGWYQPDDVVRWDGAAAYNLFFCGGPLGIPAGSDIDAAFLRGGDNSPMILSFDVPTDLSALGGPVVEPADLVEFQRTGAGCAGWTFVGLFLDASAPATPVPITDNVTGADVRAGDTVISLDVPSTLGIPTYLPGELVGWNGASFFSLYSSAAWPLSSRVDAMSFLPGPGTVLYPVLVDKSTTIPGNIVVSWTGATSAGAEDYAVYQGTIGTWYGHSPVTCTDTGGDFLEDFTPQAASSYYLVVPLNPDTEGSYGQDTAGFERPQGSSPCRPLQDLSCP